MCGGLEKMGLDSFPFSCVAPYQYGYFPAMLEKARHRDLRVYVGRVSPLGPRTELRGWVLFLHI